MNNPFGKDDSMFIVFLAALFRAAGIARVSDTEARDHHDGSRDELAVHQAQQFMRRIKQKGLL